MQSATFLIGVDFTFVFSPSTHFLIHRQPPDSPQNLLDCIVNQPSTFKSLQAFELINQLISRCRSFKMKIRPEKPNDRLLMLMNFR